MSGKEERNGKWAPWWVYLCVILGGNYVKQYLVQDLPVVVNAAITVVLVGMLFVVVTALYRGVRSANR
ncbi:hypothetical protein [Micromonospora sp. NPDC005203]|uniref:hypothetical protein n=1 Tax=Micromonospora sp. NPDC005203 TaxID=3364226 RepID=UPI0036B8EF11